MKRKIALAVVVSLAALVVGGVWLTMGEQTADLPRIPLKGGGEFRVVKIAYGTAKVHRVGGAAGPILWLWESLPSSVRRFLPAPAYGSTSVVPTNRWSSALSIYWGWIAPEGKALTGASGDVIMTTDAGERSNLGWPDPFEWNGGGYRQIFVDPPRHSRKLHFHVPVEDEAVEFTIDNPAFGK